MVLLTKKLQPFKMKRSKSSHPILVSKSSQTFAKQKSFVLDGGQSNTPEKEKVNLGEFKMEKILMEAEKCFERGEYENALIKFTRGAAVKPKDEAFTLGVKKSQLAILNDLKGTGDAIREMKEEANTATRKGLKIKFPNTERSIITSAKSLTLHKAWERVNNRLEGSTKSDIATDLKSEALKSALKLKKPEPLYNLTVRDGKNYKTISATAQDVKEYLKDKDYFKKRKDSTSEDWKKLRREINKRVAEKEAARRYEKEAKIIEEKTSVKHYCEEQVILIGRHYQHGRIADVIRFAENFMKYLNKKVDKTLPRKWVYLATAFNYLARAHTEEGAFEKARMYGEKLYKIAISSRNTELIAQSYILSGKIYVKFDKFEEAAFVWEKLIPLIQENEKKAWLFHEIGRCYFELGKYDASYKYGLESISWSEKCQSMTWCCTANVLLGQIEMKKNRYKEALDKFLEAKKYAEVGEDDQTLNYIKSVEDILNLAIKRNK